jgi:hypothetical protein
MKSSASVWMSWKKGIAFIAQVEKAHQRNSPQLALIIWRLISIVHNNRLFHDHQRRLIILVHGTDVLVLLNRRVSVGTATLSRGGDYLVTLLSGGGLNLLSQQQLHLFNRRGTTQLADLLMVENGRGASQLGWMSEVRFTALNVDGVVIDVDAQVESAIDSRTTLSRTLQQAALIAAATETPRR